jgi:hypothetical protein
MHGYIIVYHLIKFVTVSNSSTIGNHIFGYYFFGVFNEKKKMAEMRDGKNSIF